VADHENLNPRAQSAETRVVCDRAVFTSLPSPLGEGYRIVTSSSGVRAEEKIEITRRSPSHGALCSAAPGARGVTISTLAGGRVCVSLSRQAGAEHTGRGGRVWTDILLTGAQDFLVAGGHPAAFQEALASSPLPAVKLAPYVEKLAVQSRPAEAAPGLLPVAGLAEQSLAPMAALLTERSACIVAVADPVASLELLLRLLPLALRSGLNVSAGLRFSNSRQPTFCLVDQVDLETRRMTRGRPVALLDAEGLAGRPLGILAPWLNLVMRWRSEGRGAEAMTLAGSLRAGCSVQDILDVARLCESIDRSEENPEVLERMLARLAERPGSRAAAAAATVVAPSV